MAESPNSGRKLDGEALRKEGRRWIERIKAAEKLEKPWIDDAEVAVAAYTGEKSSQAGKTQYDFNILYANVETIVPAIINSPPQPDIRRRFADDDPVAKDGSELLERAIRIQVDDSRLQTEIEAEAHDGFLAGRGVIRLKFFADVEGGEPDNDDLHELAESTVEQEGGERDEDYAGDSEGTEAEAAQAGAGVATVKNERIGFEAVSWRDFRHGPAKRWEDVPWVAFRHSMPMEDMEAFADKAFSDAQALPEDKLERGETDNDVILWEVWCKKTRKVKFIEEDTGKIAKLIPDPLGLRKFFPIPTPMQPVEVTGRLMPVNPFSVYRKLADELDTITRRINVLTNAMKAKGWYAGSATDIDNMVKAEDDDFVPIADAEMWAQNGGLQGAVAFWPAEKYAQVLRELYAGRNETKQSIYEITGISDIVRGASKATETLGAQQIKSQWGSLRIQKMQRMIERTARDLFVMMAEIISSKFSPQTLEAMTGIQLLPKPQDLAPAPQPNVHNMDEQMAQQAIAEWQQAEQARQEKLQHLQALNDLLSDDVTQYYRVDVESDSTVRADLTQKKQEQAEFLQGTAAYFQGVAPMVQSGVISQEGALEIYAATARLFTLGKSTEDALEKEIASARQKVGQPKPPSPEEVKAQADAEASKAKAAADTERAKADTLKAQTEAQQVQAEGLKTLAELRSKQAEEDHARQIKMMEAQDASRARQQDIADKAALAELQRTTQAEKHAQEMEKGALELQLLGAKIQQAEVQTDNSIRQADAAIQSKEATTNAGIAAQEAKANQPKGKTNGSDI